jgi:acyl carrier protein
MSTTVGSIDDVRAWILQKNTKIDTVEHTTDLIEIRLIDSLSFVEFVFVIEQASGASIDVEQIDVDDFRSLAAIERKYFAAESPDAR